jgi:hypothetical protein
MTTFMCAKCGHEGFREDAIEICTPEYDSVLVCSKACKKAIGTIEREDFFLAMRTEESSVQINVSASDSLETKSGFDWLCLIQIGQEGNYTCAYLSDDLVDVLIKTLQAYRLTDTPVAKPGLGPQRNYKRGSIL